MLKTKSPILLFLLLIAAQSFAFELPQYHVCESADAPTMDADGFSHRRNKLLSRFNPHHSASDAITVVGNAVEISGKFTYGTISKDLEDEAIDVWMDDCSGTLKYLGRSLTDSDGRSHLNLLAETLPGPGRYRLYQSVAGDRTLTTSTLRVLLPGTHVVVFDIDGTLTTDDRELQKDIISSILGGSYVPLARTWASHLTHLRAEQGFEIVYLSGRHYLLSNKTKEWLKQGRFAEGAVIVGQSLSEIYPDNKGVGTFKLRHLTAMEHMGLQVDYAYGNAKTDVYAYANAGIPAEQIYILGQFGGLDGTVAVGEDFMDHVPDANEQPRPSQPFIRE